MKTAVTSSELSSLLTRVVQKDGRPIPVVLIADSTTEWRRIEPAIRTTAECGIYNIRFAVRTMDGFFSRSDPVFVPDFNSPLVTSTNQTVEIVLLTANNTKANAAYVRSALTHVWSSETDFATFLIHCSSNINMQSLVDVLDLLTIATRQGHASWPCLVLEKELPTKMTANKAPDIGTNAPHFQH